MASSGNWGDIFIASFGKLWSLGMCCWYFCWVMICYDHGPWTYWMYSLVNTWGWSDPMARLRKEKAKDGSSGEFFRGRCQLVYPSGESFCERNKIIQCSSQQSFVFDPYPHPQIDHKSIHNYPTSAWFSSHSAFVSVARPNTHAKWVWTLDK